MVEEQIGFRTPEGYVLSVRLNRDESRILTDAARRRGLKLSTYIKGAALADARLPHISHSLEVERTTA